MILQATREGNFPLYHVLLLVIYSDAFHCFMSSELYRNDWKIQYDFEFKHNNHENNLIWTF